MRSAPLRGEGCRIIWVPSWLTTNKWWRGRLSSSSSSLRLNRLEIQGESGSFEIHPPERSHLAVAVCYKLCSSTDRQTIQSKGISPCRLISSLAPAYSSVAARRSSALGKGGIQLMTVTRDSLPAAGNRRIVVSLRRCSRHRRCQSKSKGWERSHWRAKEVCVFEELGIKSGTEQIGRGHTGKANSWSFAHSGN